MMLKLVAIDMDDTLVRADKTFDQERFQEIYQGFQEKDIILVIASGNPYPRLNEYFSFMNHENLYLAADNGNYLVKGKKLLDENEISHSDLAQAVNFLEANGNFSIVFSDGEQTYSKGINPEYADYIISFNHHLNIISSMAEIRDKKIVKVAVHSDLELSDAKEIVNQLITRFPELDAVTSGGGWLDFYHVGGGKGSAIKKLQEKYQITKEETMVFGDSLNDASMVPHAKYAIAMGNGDQELKDIASHVIGTNEEQAVLEILEKLLKEDTLDFLKAYKKK